MGFWENEYRRFGKETYEVFYDAKKKDEAEKVAAHWRSKGYLMRIVKKKTGYILYRSVRKMKVI